MNRTINILAAFAFASAGFAVTTPANAVSANFPTAAVKAINDEGFRTCKAMGRSGYTAVARGILGDGAGGWRGAGGHPFQIRTCFTSISQCEHFLSRLHHKVSQIDELRYSGCRPR